MTLTPDQASEEQRLGKKQRVELSFVRYLEYYGITGYDRQARFAPPRRWLADFCWPKEMIIVEIEGLTYYGLKAGGAIGRHQTAKGFEQDCEKYEAAMMLGYLVYRVPHVWIIKDMREIWRPEVASNINKLLVWRAQEQA